MIWKIRVLGRKILKIFGMKLQIQLSNSTLIRSNKQGLLMSNEYFVMIIGKVQIYHFAQ